MQVKYVALFTLVFQNTTLILMMKMAQPLPLPSALRATSASSVYLVSPVW